MNKQLILETLNKYDFDKSKYYILTDASMVLQKIKEQADKIDIAVTKDYKDYLLNNYKCIEVSSNEYSINNELYFSTYYYNEDNYIYYDNYPAQRLDKIRDLKVKIGNEKDINDINILNKYLNLNPLALAYLGDGVYELYIRKYLINKGLIRVENLGKEAINYVSAKNQSKYLDNLIDNDILTEEEINIVKKGRNSKSHKAPKNTDIRTYKNSTGFEALIGYLYLNNDSKRIEEILKEIIGE